MQKVEIFKSIQIHLNKHIDRGLLNAYFVSHCCTVWNKKELYFFPFTKSDILNTKLDICNLCRYNTLLFHDLISDFCKILILCHNVMMRSFSRWLDVLENGLVFLQWLLFSWPENFIYVCTIKSTIPSSLPPVTVNTESRIGHSHLK